MKKFFTVALALIASVMLFTACAPGETQTPQASATPTPTPTVAPTPTPRETATLSDFVIIYPQSETMVAHPLKYKADDLNMALLGSVSTMCLPLSDLIDEAQGFVENKYEILLGDTNRKESDDVIAQAGNLRKYDYVIKAVGTKIVIYAATDEGYDLAFQDFARMCKENGFTAENALPAIKQIDVDHFHGNSPDGFFIDGVSIEEFVLVTSLTDKENNTLLEKILDTTGYEIPLGDVNTPQEHEIIIGNVNRPEAIQASDEIRYMDISVRVINGKLVIGAGSKDAQADAVKYFTDEILDTKVDKKEYSSATDKVIPYGSYSMSEIKLFGKDIVPSGVLYLPARDEVIAAERGITPEKLQSELDKQLRRSGLLLAEPEVLQAMEHESLEQPRYLPLRVSRDGDISGSIASAAQLGKLSRYVEKLLHEIAREVRDGNIDADPCCRSEEDSYCQFCDWASACHFQDGRDRDHLHYIRPVTPEEFWSQLDKTEGGN